MSKVYIKKILFLIFMIAIGYGIFKLITPEVDTSAYDISNLINFKRSEEPKKQEKSSEEESVVSKKENLSENLNLDHSQVKEDFYQKVDSDIMNNIMVRTELNNYPKDKVKIIYFFNYGCTVCYRIMPELHQWAHKSKSNFILKQKPVSFSRAWEKMARLYYTLELLGKNQNLDDKIMEAIHKKRINLAKDEVLMDFIGKNKIDLQIFNRTFNSNRVKKEALEAHLLSKSYEILTSPMFFVHGPGGNFATDLALTKTKGMLLNTLDYLVLKASKSRA